MRSLEIKRIVDRGKEFVGETFEHFGTHNQPEILVPNEYDALITNLVGVQTTQRMPRARIVPIGENLGSLTASAKGMVFAVSVGGRLKPAVVTDRTTAQGLHVTYLESNFDTLNPADPQLTGVQRELLRKARALQRPSVGTHEADGLAVGGEFGHQQLGFAAALKPELLDGNHPVHGWAESDQGIAGAVTDPKIVTIYDIEVNGAPREVREVSKTLTTGVLIDHPHFHSLETGSGTTPQEFAAGLGVLAVESQLGLTNATNQVLENLKRLAN